MAEPSFAAMAVKTTSLSTSFKKVTVQSAPAPVPVFGEAGNPCYQKSSCFLEQMPRLNQNGSFIPSDLVPNGDHLQSKLCAPVSGMMVLRSLPNLETNVMTGSELKSKFVGKTPQEQIRYMVNKMNTDIIEGTSFTPSMFPTSIQAIFETLADWVGGGRADKAIPGVKDQVNRSGGYVSTYNPSMNNLTLINKMKATSTYRAASMINYGHFSRSATKILGLTTYVYSRDGGHYVAVNGYDANNRILIYDPKGNYATYRNISALDLSTKWDTVIGIPYVSEIHLNIYNPFAKSVPTLFSEGGQYKIIGGYMGMYSYK